MKLTNIDRASHSLLGNAIVQALKDVGDQFGVDLVYIGGQYGNNAHIKISATVRENGTGKTSAQTIFENYAVYYGLKPDDFGKTFTSGGVVYRVTGIQPSRPKFPISGERVYDKKGFKFPQHTVVNGLAGSSKSRAA